MTTYFGLDFGLRKMGVAVGQTITATANPLTIISALDGIPHWSSLDKLVETWRPTGFVVGQPFHMDDTEAQLSEHSKKFAASIRERYQKPVYLVDERLTTKIAKQIQRETVTKKSNKHAPVDDISAQLILQTWLTEH